MPKIHACLIVFVLMFSALQAQDKRASRYAQKNYTYQITIEETPENDEKVAELGSHIVDAIHNAELEKYIEVYDLKTFGELIFKDIENNPSQDTFRDNFLKGIKKGSSVIPNRIIEEVKGDSYYDFVNYGYNIEQKTYYILCRMYSPSTGINYHEYRVSKVNNKFMFNDIYIYLSGEPLSKTYARLYLYGLPKESLLDIFGTNNATEFIKMTDAVQLYQSQNFVQAYNKFNSIEGDMNNDRFILILKAMSAAQVGDNEYKSVMQQIVEKYPNDPSLNLSRIDYHTLNNEHDTAIKLINDIELTTSDDFLNLLKGNLEYDRDNYEEALKYYKYISDNYSDFFFGHSCYLSCLSSMENYTACGEFLEFLVDDGYEKSDLIEFIEEVDENGQNKLDGLVKSEPYQKWKNQS